MTIFVEKQGRCWRISDWKFLYNLKEITLAKDAIKVPRPDTFTPANKAFPFSVNFERSKAAGTLLMIWLETRAERYVAKGVSSNFEKSKEIFSIEEIEPVNKKKPKNVKSKL